MSELACTGDLGSRTRVQATSGFRRVPESSALRSLPFRTHMRDGGVSGMADELVVAERGVLTAPVEEWDRAARRAEVIKELADQRVVGLAAADLAASRAGRVPPPGVRAGQAVESGRGPRVGPAAWHFQRRPRRRAAAGRGGGRGPGGFAGPVPDAAAADGGLGLPGDHARVQGPRPAGAVAGNGAAPDRHARPGEDGRRRGRAGTRRGRRRSAGGTPPEITGLLEQVQADHTPIDVIVVDERHRLPVGRPYLTVAIDVCSAGACSAWW